MEKAKEYCYKYPRPAYTVDAAIIIKNKILLIRRANNPYRGKWALPGGFVDMDETPEAAAQRELKEETNIDNHQLKQFKTYGAIDRDPRHRTISTVYYYYSQKQEFEPQAGDDAEEAQWFSMDYLPTLAFDHALIIQDLLHFLNLK